MWPIWSELGLAELVPTRDGGALGSVNLPWSSPWSSTSFDEIVPGLDLQVLAWAWTSMIRFKAIAAMAQNRVIGSGARIPWHLPAELKWFKRMTLGQVVVMGRKTFEAIGRPLPNRDTIVLSRTRRSLPGVRVVASLAELGLAGDDREVFICGGAQVYAQALPLCSDLYLTWVKRRAGGDVFFPPFEHLFVRAETVLDDPEFRIVHYRRQQNPSSR